MSAKNHVSISNSKVKSSKKEGVKPVPGGVSGRGRGQYRSAIYKWIYAGEGI